MMSHSFSKGEMFHCGRLGHLKKHCRDLKAGKESQEEKSERHIAFQKEAASVARQDSESNTALISIDCLQ